MTRQTFKARPVVDCSKCRTCVFYKDTALFALCTHPSSAYSATEWHTVQHMRTDGACGENAILFKSPTS